MYSIKEIQQVLKGHWHVVQEESRIAIILQDSRKLQREQAESTLFFAIKGERLNGHNYISEMYDCGIRNFVVEDETDMLAHQNCNYVIVSNSLHAMQNLVAFHRKQFNIPVIGITGSNGKTIIKEWLHQLLQNDYSICRSPKSYNSQLGVPLSVWGLNNEHNLGIFEAGISQAGEMERLEKIIQPSIGIFSTIGSAHSENFINNLHKIKEKLKLFINTDFLIYCADMYQVNQAVTEVFGHKNKPKLVTWGKSDTVEYRVVSIESRGTTSLINIEHHQKNQQFLVPFTDTSSIENALHCIVLMLHLKFKENKINERLHLLQRVAMRLEQKKGIHNSIIINDSYNSDIDSLKIALDFVKQQKQNHKHSTLILSDILQSGMPGVDLYSAVNEMVINHQITRFIGIGASLKRYQLTFNKDNFPNGLYFYDSTSDFIQHIERHPVEDEVILLKGARSFQFEKINNLLEEKAHTTRLEINLQAVLQNLNVFASQLKPGTKIMAMVKAFAYGVSAVEMARLLEFNKVDYLAVAYTDEGVNLRKAGVKLPIMVLNPEVAGFNAMISHQLEPEIYSIKLLKDFEEMLKNHPLEKPYPIHIDLDTGMKRLGFEPKQLDDLIKELKGNNLVEVRSVFSHLAGSDENQLDDFTTGQIALFKDMCTKLETNLRITPLKHIANSSGISRFKNSHFDMVRLGIGLYGFNETLQEQLACVARLKTTVSQIKDIKQGESVGYGRKGIAETDGKIATIAIGYADGLNRLLSNGVGDVFIKGQRAKIIGNVCMDMAMIDISHIEEVAEGDEVEIFGENISALELADKLKTIPYEILTSISERVNRVFYVE